MKKQKATKVKTVYLRDKDAWIVPTRERLPPHVQLTPAAIRAYFNRDKD